MVSERYDNGRKRDDDPAVRFASAKRQPPHWSVSGFDVFTQVTHSAYAVTTVVPFSPSFFVRKTSAIEVPHVLEA